MPILNYTTKIDVHTTVGQIMTILAKHGARKILCEYTQYGSVGAVSFMIDTQFGPETIRLPANANAVLDVLEKQKVKADRAQAERVAWRIIKDWVEAQMAILESGMVRMEEIFMPYILDIHGHTMFETLVEQKKLMPN